MRLGADPEVFLVNTAGKHISAIGLIKADKWNPLQIPGMAQGFTLQEDNVALEYGIPPASSADEFVAHIAAVMERSKDWLNGLSFSKLSCTLFEADQMEHPMAHIFGCEPDFNAWTGKENPRPNPPNEYLRAAGGHIHVETKKDPMQVVKLMDLYLSVPAELMDKGTARKTTGYGKLGAHRRKPYGVEYRPLSNFWIFDEKYIRWVWKQTERALSSTVPVDDLAEYIHIAVDQHDRKMARALINEFNLEVV
jgi:hypothetical protein